MATLSMWRRVGEGAKCQWCTIIHCHVPLLVHGANTPANPPRSPGRYISGHMPLASGCSLWMRFPLSTLLLLSPHCHSQHLLGLDLLGVVQWLLYTRLQQSCEAGWRECGCCCAHSQWMGVLVFHICHFPTPPRELQSEKEQVGSQTQQQQRWPCGLHLRCLSANDIRTVIALATEPLVAMFDMRAAHAVPTTNVFSLTARLYFKRDCCCTWWLQFANGLFL